MQRALTVSMAVVSLVLAGCGSAPTGGGGGGVLDRLGSLPDENGNGFPDIPTPDGVEGASRIAVELVNELTFAEAQKLANVNIPGSVTEVVDIRLRIAINMEYEDGISNRVTGSRPLDPFEIVAEAACPESISVNVTVVASVPLVGEQTLAILGPYDFQKGDVGTGYPCDSVISLRVYTDENGQPALDWLVEPLTAESDVPNGEPL
jgi:hypothetical protein